MEQELSLRPRAVSAWQVISGGESKEFIRHFCWCYWFLQGHTIYWCRMWWQQWRRTKRGFYRGRSQARKKLDEIAWVSQRELTRHSTVRRHRYPQVRGLIVGHHIACVGIDMHQVAVLHVSVVGDCQRRSNFARSALRFTLSTRCISLWMTEST